MKISAYFEEWSRRPGEPVRMAISTPFAEVEAELVRLTTGPGAAGQYQVGTEPVPAVTSMKVPGRMQNSPVGSYAMLPLGDGQPKGSFSLHCSIWPTLPGKGPQTVWALQHDAGLVKLVVANGLLSLTAGDVLVTSDMPIMPRKWYSVVATVEPEGAVLDVRLLRGHTTRREARTAGRGCAVGQLQTLMLASTGPDDRRQAADCYNGKINSPRLYAGVLSAAQSREIHLTGATSAIPIAEWLIGGDWSSRKLTSLTRGVPDGELLNGVERGVTGRNWDGRSDSFIETPAQYCALQFHEDDMVDAGWDYDLAFMLPADIRSGVYAVKLTSGSETQHYPLFVMATEERAGLRAVPRLDQHLSRLCQRPPGGARLLAGDDARHGGSGGREAAVQRTAIRAFLL